MTILQPSERRLDGNLVFGDPTCRLWMLLAGAFTLAAFVLVQEARAEDSLSVVTWDGAYGQSQKQAYFEPFSKDSGIKVDVGAYDGSLAAAKDKIGAAPPPDIIDLSS